MSEKDKPRIQWSATEIVGIGIDNPERVRKTKDGKTVLMPTSHSKIGVISEWTPPERDVVPITPLDSHMVEGREMKVVREMVPVDDAIEYGECPVCGAEPGQQCSVTDVSGWQPEGPAYVSTTELAGWVHPERGE